MKALHIKQCSDSSMWYANYVHCVVPLQPPEALGGAHMSRDTSGHANTVNLDDAEFVEFDDRFHIMYEPYEEYEPIDIEMEDAPKKAVDVITWIESAIARVPIADRGRVYFGFNNRSTEMRYFTSVQGKIEQEERAQLKMLKEQYES